MLKVCSPFSLLIVIKLLIISILEYLLFFEVFNIGQWGVVNRTVGGDYC